MIDDEHDITQMRLAYRGYKAEIKPDDDGKVFGRVINAMKDTITFEASDWEEAIEEFKLTIDFYLEECEKETANEPK